MRVGIIGGGPDDEAHLSRIGVRLGHRFEFCRPFDGEPGAVCANEGNPRAISPLLPADGLSRAIDRARPQALIFHALERPALAVHALRAVRDDPYFDGVGAIIALRADSTGAGELLAGFDDFIIYPYAIEELELRVRALELRRAEGVTHPVTVALGLTIDHAARNVLLDGRRIQLTAREFALLSHFTEWHGRVLSREHLLARVWGSQYSGGRRTVDIHVRRLRAKFGSRLPLETLRGSGYRLRPETAFSESEALPKAS